MAAGPDAQPSGLPHPRRSSALPNATRGGCRARRGGWHHAAWLAIALAGCARGGGPSPLVGHDAAPELDAAGRDAVALDAAPDAAGDATVLPPDAAPDAGCAIAAGVTPALDGVDDLAAYPAAQHLAPGAPLGSDGAAIARDASKLYVTVTSDAFAGAYEPLHVYVEAGTELPAAQPSQGKEYGGLVPDLPFTPTQLIAVRRVTDAGSGPYDGVYVPAASWTTRAVALEPGTDVFASADQRTLSVAVPWTALGGCPTALRLAVHVVHGAVANEWKELVPASHTPWQSSTTGYYELDLTGAPDVAGWTLR